MRPARIFSNNIIVFAHSYVLLKHYWKRKNPKNQQIQEHKRKKMSVTVKLGLN